jgi:hypothetical protein
MDMEHRTFRHLGREWEAAILHPAGGAAPVRFRHAADDNPRTYEGRIDREEIEEADGDDGRELALRRSLEGALVLDALAGRSEGLTAEEVAERAGMPVDDTRDRLHMLDEVQPVLGVLGPRRYRLASLES